MGKKEVVARVNSCTIIKTYDRFGRKYVVLSKAGTYLGEYRIFEQAMEMCSK